MHCLTLYFLLLEHATMKYEIWIDNGVSTIFESNSHSFNDILDEFCAAAGYIDHADYAIQMELTDSPFNIREIP
jgi:hypothetical protein